MTTENVNATAITNADATPPTLNNPHVANAELVEVVGTVETTSSVTTGSIYRLARVHSSWRPSEIRYYCDAMGGSSAADLGLYDVAAVNSGAVVSASLFGSAVSLVSAVAGTDVTYEATATNISKIESRIWELLSLSSDPGKWYDLAFTSTATITTGGTLSLRGQFATGG